MAIEYSSIMTRIYNRIKEIENQNRIPYYLFVSNDVYNVLKGEIEKSVMKTKYLKEGKIVIDIFENLEVVVYGHASVIDFIDIVGLTNAKA